MRELLEIEGQGERCRGEERQLDDAWTGHCVIADLPVGSAVLDVFGFVRKGQQVNDHG